MSVGMSDSAMEPIGVLALNGMRYDVWRDDGSVMIRAVLSHPHELMIGIVRGGFPAVNPAPGPARGPVPGPPLGPYAEKKVRHRDI